jgi:outer membrane protein assembly factor BamD
VTLQIGLVSGNARLLTAALLVALALIGGCRTRGLDREANRLPVNTLYTNAKQALDNNDFEYAIRLYEALTARFPFTSQARQARLDLIYLYYRKGEKESATDAAEQFLRENPTHPRCDYAWYMKGLVEFERVPYRFERWFGVDMARRPPASAVAAVTAFGTVVSRYPKSEYAHDAQRRMVYLRNRLAEYEINVARYYIKRGAYLAAAQRAQRTIEQYDGAPAVQEALQLMIESYDRLGLTELKANIERTYAENFPGVREASRSGRSWWRFW